MTYNEWMKKVNALAWNTFGCSIHDLPDFPSRDLFEDGYTPEEFIEEVAEDMLEDMGGMWE
jgi:hypothetical protein